MTSPAHLLAMLRQLRRQNEEQRKMLDLIEAELAAANDTKAPPVAVMDEKVDLLLKKKGLVK